MKRMLPGVAAAALLLPILCAAQAPTAAEKVSAVPVIPRSALFGNPEKTQARVSPDGKYVSFIAPKDGVLNVWVGPRTDPSAAKAVTNDTKRGIRQHFWAYDNKHVLYLQDEGGDENWHKRHQTADLRGRVALVTGGRVKIGYQTCILLLRAGCRVVVTTRFPRDAARRSLDIAVGHVDDTLADSAYIAGDSFGAADIGIHWAIHIARMIQSVDLDEMKNVARYMAQIDARPAAKTAYTIPADYVREPPGSAITRPASSAAHCMTRSLLSASKACGAIVVVVRSPVGMAGSGKSSNWNRS